MPLESFLDRRGGTPALALSAVFAALAALTRYMGVALIISGVLILLARRNVPVRQRLKHALAFGAISSLPLAGVMVRNQLVSGALFGIRTGSGGTGPVGTVPVQFAGSDRRGVPAVGRPAVSHPLAVAALAVAGCLPVAAAGGAAPRHSASEPGVFCLLDLRTELSCDYRRGGTTHGRGEDRQPIPRAGLRPAAVRRGVLAGRTPARQAVWQDVRLPGRWSLSCLSAAPGILASRCSRICG